MLSSLHFLILFSVFLQFPTRQSFTLLQHCMLCLAFPSNYQILQKHFQGPLSRQGKFLHFSTSTIFWSLSSNPGTFLLFLFFSTPTSAGTAISIIIPFYSFLSINIRPGRLASIRLSYWMLMSHSTLISSFSTAASGECSYHFSLCFNPFSLQISH